MAPGTVQAAEEVLAFLGRGAAVRRLRSLSLGPHGAYRRKDLEGL